MQSYSELLDILNQHVLALETVEMSTDQAHRRTLAQPANAVWDLPRFDNSAMDGYAVKAADTRGASAEQPISLEVSDAAYAGHPSDLNVGPGQAFRIGTGGVIPRGADAIVPRENTHITQDSKLIQITQAAKVGDHIRRQGEECRLGETILDAGTLLSGYAIAALQAAGLKSVTVRRPPRIKILATGDELIAPGQTPQPGQIIETNGGFLKTMLRAWLQVEIDPVVRVIDDPNALAKEMEQGVSEYDLTITTGGVSVGDRDFVKDMAEQIGCTKLLWKVAIKPGKPLFIAKRGRTFLLGLPGNPAAVGVALPTVVLPLLRLMAGQKNIDAWQPFRLDQAVNTNATRLHFRWATVVRHGAELFARPLEKSGSHMLSDLALADILIQIPPSESELKAGSLVEGIWLPR